MTNWTELKRLAEEATGGDWEFRLGLIRTKHDSDGYVPVAVAPNSPKSWRNQRDLNMQFIATANPKTILALIAENERLESALSAPETITVEPAAGYEALRKQFMSLRMLANSNAKMVQHWRNQCGRETRETLLANADNVNAERDTNALLTDALEASEAERDQLRADVEALRQSVKDMLYAQHVRPSCQDGIVDRCRCWNCSSDRASAL